MPKKKKTNARTVFLFLLTAELPLTLMWHNGRVWIQKGSWMERTPRLTQTRAVAFSLCDPHNDDAKFKTWNCLWPTKACTRSASVVVVLHEPDRNYPLKLWCLIITDCKWIGMCGAHLQDNQDSCNSCQMKCFSHVWDWSVKCHSMEDFTSVNAKGLTVNTYICTVCIYICTYILYIWTYDC